MKEEPNQFVQLAPSSSNLGFLLPHKDSTVIRSTLSQSTLNMGERVVWVVARPVFDIWCVVVRRLDSGGKINDVAWQTVPPIAPLLGMLGVAVVQWSWPATTQLGHVTGQGPLFSSHHHHQTSCHRLVYQYFEYHLNEEQDTKKYWFKTLWCWVWRTLCVALSF